MVRGLRVIAMGYLVQLAIAVGKVDLLPTRHGAAVAGPLALFAKDLLMVTE